MNIVIGLVIIYLIISVVTVLHIRSDRRWFPFPTWTQAIKTALKYQIYFVIIYISISLFFEALTVIFSHLDNFNL